MSEIFITLYGLEQKRHWHSQIATMTNAARTDRNSTYILVQSLIHIVGIWGSEFRSLVVVLLAPVRVACIAMP